ncbi:hypothetical protein F4553_007867 [Allocatelliglobosispora scoriae]|uniref:Uncharacterized protein n=1 Tax=Allocatelliglobosispora scoriae TaxID=643052 RepID=A0A841C5N0_9ACTN|nr:hypothetical protein [Allocatelliglobosispora scoriae]MBB5874433.1 hypothetical protein [Allocatelliglobosispora scoriae]
MSRSIASRMRIVALAAVLAAGGLTVGATPAQAAPPGCSMGAGHYESAGGFINAYRYWFCDDGNDIPLSVSIQRYQSPGVYSTVASGSGDVTYYCGGTLYNVYRTTGTSDFAILCS